MYASVFLHKAQGAGAFQSAEQRQEIANSVQRFILQMENASPNETHLCCRYSGMLKRIWCRQEGSPAARRRANLTSLDTTQAIPNQGGLDDTGDAGTAPSLRNSHSQNIDGALFPPDSWVPEDMGLGTPPDTVPLGNDDSTTRSLDGYLFGSFFPGVADFEYQPVFDISMGMYGEA